MTKAELINLATALGYEVVKDNFTDSPTYNGEVALMYFRYIDAPKEDTLLVRVYQANLKNSYKRLARGLINYGKYIKLQEIREAIR